jgi:C-1 hydroxylase
MSAEANKALVLDFLASWNRGDFGAMTCRWSPDMVHHTRTSTYGTAQVFGLISGFMRAFPDLKFEIDNIVAEGDYVATRMTARATHRNDFMGIPATGKQITCTAMGLVRIVDGRIVEHWSLMDELYLMQQLHLVPDDYLTAMASS